MSSMIYLYVDDKAGTARKAVRPAVAAPPGEMKIFTQHRLGMTQTFIGNDLLISELSCALGGDIQPMHTAMNDDGDDSDGGELNRSAGSPHSLGLSCIDEVCSWLWIGVVVASHDDITPTDCTAFSNYTHLASCTRFDDDGGR